MRSSPPRTRFAVLLFVGLAGACAPRAEQIFGTGPQGEGTITLEVSNRNFSDATVYAIRHGDRLRAGVIGGKGRASFRVRWRTPAPLRVSFELLGGGSCTTREVRAEPGDVVSVDIPMELRTDPECTAPGVGDAIPGATDRPSTPGATPRR